MDLVSSIINESLVVIQWGVIISASLAAAICDWWIRKTSVFLIFLLLLAGLIWISYCMV